MTATNYPANKIYAIGDSHSLFWSGMAHPPLVSLEYDIQTPELSDEHFKVFHLGPCLAYNTNKLGSKNKSLEKTLYLLSSGLIPKTAIILCSFGEIDVRVHFLKKGMVGLSERLQSTVDSYLSFLSFLKGNGYAPICYGPVASQKDDWGLNSEFLRAGDEVARNRATVLFSQELKKQCEQSDIHFFSLLDLLLDDKSHTISDVYRDHCHISDKLYPTACELLFAALRDTTYHKKINIDEEYNACCGVQNSGFAPQVPSLNFDEVKKNTLSPRTNTLSPIKSNANSALEYAISRLKTVSPASLSELLASPEALPDWVQVAAPPLGNMDTDNFVQRYLIRNFNPARHLEFGTWKGEGVKRVIEECEASVWTINLWEGEQQLDGGCAYAQEASSLTNMTDGLEGYGKFVRTDAKSMIGIEYLEAGLGNRVNQIYSDSRLWRDEAYPDGFFDSAFVDGGHDAETARCDMYKALRLLRPGGLLLMHDFCPLPEVNAQHPNTVGVTSMVFEELENIKKMCDDVFWIEGTWLLCGIRRKETTETLKQKEQTKFKAMRDAARMLAETELTKATANGQNTQKPAGTKIAGNVYLYKKGLGQFEHSSDSRIDYENSTFTPGGAESHLTTRFFLLPEKIGGVQTLSIKFSFANSNFPSKYLCQIQDESYQTLAEFELAGQAAEEEHEVKIVGNPEAHARLLMKPEKNIVHTLPALIKIDTDSFSLAAQLAFENTILKHERHRTHQSKWFRIGRKLGLLKFLSPDEE